MRAFVLTEFGAAPQLTDLDVPEPAEGEVRVRVLAASVNGFDLSVAAGYLEDMMEHRFPVVLGQLTRTPDSRGDRRSGAQAATSGRPRTQPVITAPARSSGRGVSGADGSHGNVVEVEQVDLPAQLHPLLRRNLEADDRRGCDRACLEGALAGVG
jgi:hypothetical protein